MNDQEKFESYLLSLERALTGTTSIKRNQIVSDARLAVEQSLNQGKNLDQALLELGSVADVCQRAGFPVSQRSGWKRLLFIVFVLGFISMAMTVTFGGWLLTKVLDSWNTGDWAFQINSSESFEDEMDQFLLGGRIIPQSEEEALIEDKRDVVHYKISHFKVIFPNGKLRFKWVDGDSLEWTCKISGTGREGSANAQDGLLVLDMGQAFGTKCDVKIPRSVSVSIEGINGDIQVIRPTQSVDVQLTNGRVQIDDRSDVAKKFELSAKNGRVHTFESSSEANAKVIKVSIANGMIGRFEEE